MWWYEWIFYVFRIFEWMKRPFHEGLKLIGNSGQRLEVTNWIEYEDRKTVDEPSIEQDKTDKEVIVLEQFKLPVNGIHALKTKDTAIELYNGPDGVISIIVPVPINYLRILVYCGLTFILLKAISYLVRRFRNRNALAVYQTLEVQVCTEALHYNIQPMFYFYLMEFRGNQWTADIGVDNALRNIVLYQNERRCNLVRISFVENQRYMNSNCLYKIEMLVKIFYMLATATPSFHEATGHELEMAINNDDNLQGWWVEDEEEDLIEEDLIEEDLIEEDEATQVDESTDEIEFIDNETSSNETLKPPEEMEELMSNVMAFSRPITQEENQLPIVDISNLSDEENQNDVENVALLLYYPDGSPCTLDCQKVVGI